MDFGAYTSVAAAALSAKFEAGYHIDLTQATSKITLSSQSPIFKDPKFKGSFTVPSAQINVEADPAASNTKFEIKPDLSAFGATLTVKPTDASQFAFSSKADWKRLPTTISFDSTGKIKVSLKPECTLGDFKLTGLADTVLDVTQLLNGTYQLNVVTGGYALRLLSKQRDIAIGAYANLKNIAFGAKIDFNGKALKKTQAMVKYNTKKGVASIIVDYIENAIDAAFRYQTEIPTNGGSKCLVGMLFDTTGDKINGAIGIKVSEDKKAFNGKINTAGTLTVATQFPACAGTQVKLFGECGSLFTHFDKFQYKLGARVAFSK